MARKDYTIRAPHHAIFENIDYGKLKEASLGLMGPENARWDKRQAALGASFLQSALWGDFQGSIGYRPHYLFADGWSCLLLERRTAFGRYLFAPYGPTVPDISSMPAALKDIRSFSKENGFDWIRLEPVIKSGTPADWHRQLRLAGAKKAPHEAEPHLTRVVDLDREPEDILASLSQTTRNLVRRNQRDNVLVFRTSRDPSDMPLFSKMLDTVASRKGVGFFSADYYQKQAETLMPAGMMILEIASDGTRPVGAAVIHDYHKTASYTYAASDPAARDKNVSALLLWQAMLNAKIRGNIIMDLYGIAPDDAPPSHPWQGFSAFKKKFGGQVIERAGTWDIPVGSRYKLYRSAAGAKRILKRR